MRRELVVLLGMYAGFVACSTGEEPREDMDALIDSLSLDVPVDLVAECPPVPEGAQEVLFAGVFANSPPLRPGDAEFPEDFCSPSTDWYARAEGHGRSSLLRDFVWWEHYCVDGGELVAEGYFEDSSGDRLNWDALIRPDSVPPPVPFVTFSGSFSFTGGTGRYAGLRGEAVVDAEQLGDAAPGRPAGTTAAALCGWLSE